MSVKPANESLLDRLAGAARLTLVCAAVVVAARLACRRLKRGGAR